MNRLIRGGITGASIVAIGLLFALFIIGWRVINPLDDTWFVGDPATGYLGWLYFRKEEWLSFPLGWAAGIGYPLGEPIAYFDSLPLVAVFFWSFRQLLPETFQYHGLVFTISCILQLYFGYRLMLRLSPNNRICAILGGILFMMAPPFVWRADGHFALANHWMILAALEFFLVSKDRISAWQIVLSALLCFFAGATNPYIAFMTLLLVGAGYARPLFEQGDLRSAVRTAIISGGGAAVSALSALGAMILFGFVALDDQGMYAGGGYGIYSMNLLSPINPGGYPSPLLKSQNTFEGQYEGYNYLGLGVLLLAVVSLSYRPSLVLIPFRRRYIPAWGVVGICLFLALSLKATVGHTIIYEINPPETVLELLSAFRSSGRLFWPAFYLILLTIIAAAIFAFGRRAAILTVGDGVASVR